MFNQNKKFIFSIIDDTDNATYKNIKPIYDFLYEKGIFITKTVWVYPSRHTDRDTESKGDSLQNTDYRNFILDIKNKGYEIALHNIGSGNYFREEIIQGLEDYKNIIGEYPNIHINHSYNFDNIYSGTKRFSFPFNYLVKVLYPKYSASFGDDPTSKYFWGDVHKKLITYNRNYEIDSLNTIKYNPYIPYKDANYDEYSNYWFSSTFAPNPWVFNRLVNKNSIDDLEKRNGICILFTHLGYFIQNGEINKDFINIINYLSNKNTGWFIPVSQALNFLKDNRKYKFSSEYIKPWIKKYLELMHLITRFKYRYIIKIDDFHFKKMLNNGK